MDQNDSFYDYREFNDERLKNLLLSWDGFGGNHGAAIKFCANLLIGDTVLDVGCGFCHLYEVLKTHIKKYVGIDIDKRIINWAKKRYPDLDLHCIDAHDLSILGEQKFDTVFAIGLYRRINEHQSLNELLGRARKAAVITYLHRTGSEPKYFPSVFWQALNNDEIISLEFFNNKIKALEIVRFNIEN